MSDNEFGNLVRELRQAAGLTQQQLADKVGVHISQINKIELGRRTPTRRGSRDQVVRLAQVLGDKDGRLLQLSGFEPRGDERVVRTRPPFRELILTEPTLTSDQKRIMVGLYDSWVGGG